ncbi:MAG TPA: glucokinase [Burkholderiales bacterium]|nr:glucokinase [Burkholderiales bacterium]
MILAGDIGGTSSRFAYFDVIDGKLVRTCIKIYSSQQYSNLAKIVQLFIHEHPASIAQTCLGIAAPVHRGVAKTPNLPWEVEVLDLVQKTGLKELMLINDLEANAWGIGALGEADFYVLNAGDSPATGNQAVISAGTGLGEAGLYWDGKTHHPFACEGGHGDFAPRNALQAEFMLYLGGSRGKHVSYERVLSGPGLKAIYEFLRDTGRKAEQPEMAEKLAKNADPALISEAALNHTCALCEMAMEFFVSFYGAEAGNVALKFMATGGVYLGGGIAPKIIAALKQPTFMRAFIAKGRMQPLLESMPVRVILNPDTALLGSARCAALRSGMLDI